MESETSLCFWAQADALGSPDHQIVFFFVFFVSHTVSETTILAFIIIIEEEWRKKKTYLREFSLPLAMY